ncbi:CinA family protein [Pedobacter faecalis]|uniref:CinA family protein n=1 Tax=Pedobacter faecalis TaxID=3041495 RepID=UPI0025516250|nr:CinA family protein [Pedobacter sp. ELA7]
MENAIVTACTELLIDKGLTIAFAESATAGRLTSEFALAGNAGKFLKGGLACYDACIKEELLKVPDELVQKFTPESAEVTEAIAKGLASLIEADIHVGITGLTTSGGSETLEKPVGTMFIHAMLRSEHLFQERIVFTGEQEQIVVSTVIRTAELLYEHLSSRFA